jgi:hypothetical protein
MLYLTKYYYGDQTRVDKMGGACSTNGRDEKAYSISVRKSEGKRQLARPKRRWEDNIIMDVREVGLEVVYGMHLAQDSDRWRTLVKTVMNLRVP